MTVSIKGGAYKYNSEISVTAITGRNGRVIKPRVLKTKEEQTERAKGMAEVFTPSWICNAQNNLVDEAWFGRKDVFNIEDFGKKTQSTQKFQRTVFCLSETWNF
ncbi:MAG: hypothetical protein J6V33_10150 [Bacteroidales bacterium]|nr:hypothetical protein [Bacteroidales bacterium]